MESLAWLAVLVPLLGVGVVVVFIVAIIQEGKSERRGFKQAFFTVVALVMLGISVGAIIGLLNTTLKNVAFGEEQAKVNRYSAPPFLFLPGAQPVVSDVKAVKPETGTTVQAYTCTSECQFTADDKAAVASWKAEYRQWQSTTNANYNLRRDLAALLPFIIIAVPLFIVFFRLMQRGAAAESAETKKLSPLRSLYFYFIAFSGLLIAVIGAGGLVNLGLNQVLKVDDQGMLSVPAQAYDTTPVKSLIACAEQCDFSSDDVALANEWLVDAEKFTKGETISSGKITNDLSNFLPLLLVGFPLFWYHFARIRKESQDTHVPTIKTPTPAV